MDKHNSVEFCKENNLNLNKCTLVNTEIYHDIEEFEDTIDKIFLKNRHKSTMGRYIGYIPLTEESLWVVEHRDATIGAYFHDEISEYIKVEMEMKK